MVFMMVSFSRAGPDGRAAYMGSGPGQGGHLFEVVLCAVATFGQADVVKDTGGEQLSLPDVTSHDQTLVLGQESCEQVIADA
jgi:hypothetical protein